MQRHGNALLGHSVSLLGRANQHLASSLAHAVSRYEDVLRIGIQFEFTLVVYGKHHADLISVGARVDHICFPGELRKHIVTAQYARVQSLELETVLGVIWVLGTTRIRWRVSGGHGVCFLLRRYSRTRRRWHRQAVLGDVVLLLKDGDRIFARDN